MKKKLGVFMVCLLLMTTGCVSQVDEGKSLLEKQKTEEAQEKFQEAIEKGKDVAEAYRGLGYSYYEQKKYAEALEAFEQALNEGTEPTAILYNLAGICAMQSENYEKAVYYLEDGQRYGDASEELLQEMAFNLIVSYEQMGEYVIAKEKLQDYVSRYPDDEKAVKELEFLNTQS